nr:hypothetical protein [Tanacetum cinerariifolium]
MPDLEGTTDLQDTGIFSGPYDDEIKGAVADFNNLELTTIVSPIITTKIHKDHPKEQTIGDPLSAPQTRRMTKTFQEHAMVSYIKKQRRTNHKDYQNCLFACFFSQIEPKKVIQALIDPSWIEAMQDELLQFRLQKMDMKSVFLYGTIEKEVYVYQPPSFQDPYFSDKVYKVKKALYGLHQAPRAWYETLSTYLLENRFRRGIIDKTLFIKKDKGDLRIDVQEVPDEFYGGAHFLLKVAVKTTSNPIETNKALLKDEEDKDVDVYLYRSMIFRYLKGQPKLGIWHPKDSPFDLEAFLDSDYAGASLDKKPTTRGCQFIGKRLIAWEYKKQTLVSNSTTEAEYVVAANCCGQVLWIQN